ncbi:hypothetical protein CHS0354_030965 [Potamilus streckersoni]|uniref:GRAM domain-containing protein n=1 Tax=Potamilus streckersoni TaxID=2493646 RepID=A0AAE0VVM9_9BIVA|nr:hypothetical protein CHS0354_030965 [Potamilus streckersoni]
MSFLKKRVKKTQLSHSRDRFDGDFDVIEMKYDNEPIVSDDQLSLSSYRDDQEKVVFEQQLNQLQDQLVAITIENQKMAAELEEYKTSRKIKDLILKFEQEKGKRKALEQKCDIMERNFKRQGAIEREKQDSDASLRRLDSSIEALQYEDNNVDKSRSRLDSFWEKLLHTVYEIVDDFTIEPERKGDNSDGEPLTVRQLKANIKRFKEASKPYMDTIKGIQNLLSWKSPSYTFIVFTIYFYLAWRGWFLPFVIFLGVIRLSVTFLQSEGFKINICYFDSEEDGTQGDSKELGMSEKFNLVIEVARKVQNGLGTAADSLEKIKNLFIWRYPKGTRRVFSMLCVGFIVSCFVPIASLLTFIGFSFGMKIFLVDNLYRKYPRLKRKHDSMYRLWLDLPTDAQYDRKYVRSAVDKYIMVSKEEGLDDSTSIHETELDITVHENCMEFCELFSLPSTETPLNGWEDGKGCVLIGKDPSPISLLLKRGKLYLTKSFLCFERTKVPSQKNILVPLADIIDIRKVKIFYKLPGKGMAIEIFLEHEGRRNSIKFGGLLYRDEVVDQIIQAGLMLDLPWAKGDPLWRKQTSERQLSDFTKRSNESPQRIQNLTMAAYYDDSE